MYSVVVVAMCNVDRLRLVDRESTTTTRLTGKGSSCDTRTARFSGGALFTFHTVDFGNSVRLSLNFKFSKWRKIAHSPRKSLLTSNAKYTKNTHCAHVRQDDDGHSCSATRRNLLKEPKDFGGNGILHYYCSIATTVYLASSLSVAK